MMTQLIAYCGLDCSQCPAYIATQAEDIPKLTSLAQEWLEGAQDYTLMLCDGCIANGRNTNGHLMQWCSECQIRDCAIDQGIPNCAHCSDYGCEKLMVVFENSAEAKANLDRIRFLL